MIAASALRRLHRATTSVHSSVSPHMGQGAGSVGVRDVTPLITASPAPPLLLLLLLLVLLLLEVLRPVPWPLVEEDADDEEADDEANICCDRHRGWKGESQEWHVNMRGCAALLSAVPPAVVDPWLLGCACAPGCASTDAMAQMAHCGACVDEETAGAAIGPVAPLPGPAAARRAALVAAPAPAPAVEDEESAFALEAGFLRAAGMGFDVPPASPCCTVAAAARVVPALALSLIHI